MHPTQETCWHSADCLILGALASRSFFMTARESAVEVKTAATKRSLFSHNYLYSACLHVINSLWGSEACELTSEWRCALPLTERNPATDWRVSQTSAAHLGSIISPFHRLAPPNRAAWEWAWPFHLPIIMAASPGSGLSLTGIPTAIHYNWF